MSKGQLVKEFILKNRDLDNHQVAKELNTTHNFVCNCRGELRKEGLLPKLEKGWQRNTKRKAGQPVKTEETIHEGIKKAFQKKDVYSIEELSDKFDVGVSRIRSVVEELIQRNFNFTISDGNILFSKTIEKSESKVLDVQKMSSGFYRFGVVGDNHLCSRYERLDVLNALYDLFKAEGVNVVYNTGNWIDGEARFNKHDLKVYGLDNQLNYFIEKYPQREGIVTHYITGDDHEGWYTQREGINVGKYAMTKAIEAGRNDLVFLGHMEADVILPAPNGQTVIRVLHPGGGSAYAISYTSQKIVESYTEEEKPDILLDGHYHKAGYNYIRGVHVVQTACTQDQTPFMRKKKLAAHLGGWIIEFATDSQGRIVRFKKEFIPFFDNKYYERWGYKWK